MILTYFTFIFYLQHSPHTPSTRSITHRFLSLEGEHMYLAIPPSNTQHSVSHKCCYRNSLGSKRFQSSYCAKVRAEVKKRLKGEGEGRRGVPSFPSPSPVILFFFALVPAFQTNLARKRLLRRLLQKPLISYFVAFTNNREIKHIIVLASVEGISFVFFVGVLACKNIRLFVRKKRIKK